jgi:hypothetical protein
VKFGLKRMKNYSNVANKILPGKKRMVAMATYFSGFRTPGF